MEVKNLRGGSVEFFDITIPANSVGELPAKAVALPLFRNFVEDGWIEIVDPSKAGSEWIKGLDKEEAKALQSSGVFDQVKSFLGRLAK
jgi:hypothetical protein